MQDTPEQKGLDSRYDFGRPYQVRRALEKVKANEKGACDMVRLSDQEHGRRRECIRDIAAILKGSGS